MIIARDKYLQQLIAAKGNGMVKRGQREKREAKFA